MTPPPTAREVEAPSFTVTPDAFDRSDRAFSVGHSTDGVPAVNAYHALSTTSMMSHDDGRVPMYGNGNGQSSSLVGTGSQAFITRPDEIAATQNQAEVQSDVRAETQHVVTSAFPPDPSSSNDHSNVVLDVTDYLDPALPNAQTTSPPPSQSRWTPLRGGIGQPMAFHDDPGKTVATAAYREVYLLMASSAQSRQRIGDERLGRFVHSPKAPRRSIAYDRYYEHLNPVISLLDPTCAHHTVDDADTSAHSERDPSRIMYPPDGRLSRIRQVFPTYDLSVTPFPCSGHSQPGDGIRRLQSWNRPSAAFTDSLEDADRQVRMGEARLWDAPGLPTRPTCRAKDSAPCR